ncbi:MAG TPA: hypothetical protein PKC30_14600 [Saprospiraceae bacterium]|nr:hypothetical protein [Saprospiraceae bacterium]
MRKQIIAYILFTILTLIVGGILYYHSGRAPSIILEIEFNSDYDEVQLFHRNFTAFNELQSQRVQLIQKDDFQKIHLFLPDIWIKGFRLDPGLLSDTLRIRSITLTTGILRDSIPARNISEYFNVLFVSSSFLDHEENLVIAADVNRDIQLIAKENVVQRFCVLDQARWNFNLIILLLFYLAGILTLCGISYFKMKEKLFNNTKVSDTIRSFRTYWIEHKENWIHIVCLSIAICIVVQYYISIYRFSVNFPYWDEYYSAFGLMDQFHQLKFPDNVLLLFRQHNEHRMFAYHILPVLQNAWLGEINFSHINLFSNAFLIVLCFLLLICLPKNYRMKGITILPVVMLLFVPLHEISNWGLMNMNGTFQYVLVLGSLALLERQDVKAFVLSLILVVIATFSFGNGMFGFLLGYFVMGLNDKKPWHKIGIWTVVFMICLLLYFHNYQSVGHHPSKMIAFQQPVMAVQFFLVFMSGVFEPALPHIIKWLAASGVLLIATFLLLIWNNRTSFQKHRLIISYMLFILMNAGATMMSRVGFGVGAATAPRYALMSVIFLAALYVLWISSVKYIRKSVLYILLGMSMILFYFRWQKNYRVMSIHYENQIHVLHSYKNELNQLSYTLHDHEFVRESLTSSIQKGYYHLPNTSELFPCSKRLDTEFNGIEENELSVEMERLDDRKAVLDIFGHIEYKMNLTKKENILVVLHSDIVTYTFTTCRQSGTQGSWRNRKYRLDGRKRVGFRLVIDKAEQQLKPGDYQLRIGVLSDGLMMIKNLDEYTITVI